MLGLRVHARENLVAYSHLHIWCSSIMYIFIILCVRHELYFEVSTHLLATCVLFVV